MIKKALKVTNVLMVIIFSLSQVGYAADFTDTLRQPSISKARLLAGLEELRTPGAWEGGRSRNMVLGDLEKVEAAWRRGDIDSVSHELSILVWEFRSLGKNLKTYLEGFKENDVEGAIKYVNNKIGVTINNREYFVKYKPEISESLEGALHKVGLSAPEKIQLSQIAGSKVDTANPFDDPTLTTSLLTTNGSTIAAHFGVGCGLDKNGLKIQDKALYNHRKNIADGGAVAVLEEYIKALAETLDAVIIVGGSEGKQRDEAPALNVKQVFNPTGSKGIYVVFSDPVEGTNMEATDEPGAWTAFALVKLPKASEEMFRGAVELSGKSMQEFLYGTRGKELARFGIPFCDDTYFISFVAQSPEPFSTTEVRPTTRSDDFLRLVAQKRGILPQDFTKNTLSIVLRGNRIRHDEGVINPLIDLGAAFKEVSDGDLVPGTWAGTGTGLGNAVTSVKPGGAGGVTEQWITALALAGREFNGEKAQLIMFRASPKGIKGAGLKDMTGYDRFSDSELETYDNLGIDPLKPITGEDLAGFERTVVVSSITGPRLDIDIPSSLKGEIDRVTVKGNIITVKSLVIDKEGRVFIAETQYKCEDPEMTRLRMLATNNFHLPDAPGVREYAIRQLADSKTPEEDKMWLHRLEVEREDISEEEKNWIGILLNLKKQGRKTVKGHEIDSLIDGELKGRLSLIVDGERKIRPIRRKGIAIASSFEDIRDKMIFDMTSRGKGRKEIASRIKELEDAFGILSREAKKAGLEPEDVISTYDQIMEEVAEATIAGKIAEPVLATMSQNQKHLLLPINNAKETAEQVGHILLLAKNHGGLRFADGFGIEVEVGHVDKKVPNPRRKGAMEAKMTHPAAVRVMGKELSYKGLSTDLIATNNGSGHGTDFDKKELTPVSQVGKITPYLTRELQNESGEFGASIAQHGTSGSDMDELAELSEQGVIKFNVATNYQQIILNVLSLLDDGVREDRLLSACSSDKDALVSGLHENTREKIKALARQIKIDNTKAEIKETDSLFIKFLKGAYAYGVKKGKIKDNSSKEDIATLLAKEFKRAFNAMDEEIYALRDSKVQEAITFLIRTRDNQYLKAVGATNTAKLVSLSEDFEFAPGRDAFKALRNSGKATIAVNIVSYNQIEGHLLAAMDQDAILILEVARSQLSYALDEKKVMQYIREVVEKTGCKIPIVVHGDHIQYSEGLFKQKAILKEEYEKVNSKGSFSEDVNIDTIDESIVLAARERLEENARAEGDAITTISERLIDAGFTSIAIDASTIFDEVAGDAVLDYYLNHGTPAQKLVVALEEGFALPLEWGADILKARDKGTALTKAMGAAAARELAKTDEQKIKEIRQALSETGKTFTLADTNGGEINTTSEVLNELLDLNLLDLDNVASADEGARYLFNLAEINLKAFTADYVLNRKGPVEFARMASNLVNTHGKKVAIVATSDDEEKALTSNSAIASIVDGENIYIKRLESELIGEWLVMSVEDGSYDFLNISIEELVQNNRVTDRARVTAK